MSEPRRTIETRENCVLETWYYNGEVVGTTVLMPGCVPSAEDDPEEEFPAGYLGSIDPLNDGTFEADISGGHAPPLGTYPTFDAALEAILR